jgi:hypothetical protein
MQGVHNGQDVHDFPADATAFVLKRENMMFLIFYLTLSTINHANNNLVVFTTIYNSEKGNHVIEICATVFTHTLQGI